MMGNISQLMTLEHYNIIFLGVFESDNKYDDYSVNALSLKIIIRKIKKLKKIEND